MSRYGLERLPVWLVIVGAAACGAESPVQPENPVPQVAGIEPAMGTAGLDSLGLSLSGSGFVAQSVVRFRGADHPTTGVTEDRLRAVLRATDLDSTGVFDLTVFNPTPGGGTSAAVPFTIINPLPVLSALQPSRVETDMPAFTLQVRGHGFVPSSRIVWNGTPRTTAHVSDSLLTTAVAPDEVDSTGVVLISVLTPAPGGGASGTLGLPIVYPPPWIVRATPQLVEVGSAGFTLTVEGMRFVPASVIRWNGVDRATTFVAGGRLTTAVTDADLALMQRVEITVFTPPPGGGVSDPAEFIVANPLPRIDGVSPDSVDVRSDSLTVIISGMGFLPTTAVMVGFNLAPVTYVSPTELRVLIAATSFAVGGPLPIQAANPGPWGGGLSNPHFLMVMNPSPQLMSLAPDSVVAGDTGTVELRGADFVPGSEIRLEQSRFTPPPAGDSILRLVLWEELTRTPRIGWVRVINYPPGGGISDSLPLRIVNTVPSVLDIGPDSMPAGYPPFALTVQGAGFSTNSEIQWGGTSVPTRYIPPLAEPAAALTATVPQALLSTAGPAEIRVFNPSPNGGLSSPSLFVVGERRTTDVIIAELWATALAYDSTRNVIYVAVAAAGPEANSVVALDPATGTVLRSLGVGSIPSRLALSSDARWLYVALDGEGAVRRVDLTTFSLDIRVSLGTSSCGTLYADDLVALPAEPRAVAVALRCPFGVSPRHAGVRIYDDAVARPTATSPGHGSNQLEPGASSGRLYGLDTEGGSGFRLLNVNAFGVTEASIRPDLLSSPTPITFHAGRIYAGDGSVLDPEGGTRVGETGLAGMPLPQANAGYFFQLEDRLFASDIAWLGFVEDIVLPVRAARSPITWGSDGIAYIGQWGNSPAVFLFRRTTFPR